MDDDDSAPLPEPESALLRKIRRVSQVGQVGVRQIVGEARDAVWVKTNGALDVTKPRRFYGILNERCNLKCQGCDYWRREHYVDEMGPEEWIRVLQEIKDFVGPFHINFSGGEPLLKHRLFDILNFCRDNQILAGMTSNGIILKDRQAAQLVEAKLFSLNVSLDGNTEATHDLQRGVKGSHKGVLRTIRLMHEHSDRTGIEVPLVIKPTVSRLNFQEMPDLVKKVADLRVRGILFQPISDWGTDEIENLWIHDIARLEEVVGQLLDLKAQGYPILSADWHLKDWIRHFRKEKTPAASHPDDVQCWVGLTTFVIKTDGTIVNCHTLDPIGNVKTQAVEDLWYSPLAKERRAETVKCTIACSENCNVKRTVRQNIEGAKKLLFS
jgi:radical SAM protein with 4Fe4S-binding SPASM domain